MILKETSWVLYIHRESKESDRELIIAGNWYWKTKCIFVLLHKGVCVIIYLRYSYPFILNYMLPLISLFIQNQVTQNIHLLLNIEENNRAKTR